MGFNKKGATFRPILITLILLMLLGVIILMFAAQFAINNNSTQDLSKDPVMANYLNQMKSSLNDNYIAANESENALKDSPNSAALGVGRIIYDAIGGIWRSLKAAPTVGFYLTFGLLKNYLGAELFYIVIGAIGSIFILTIIIVVWKLVYTGHGG